MQRRTKLTLGGIVAALLLTGCGANLPTASGVVTLDGKPLDRGRVTFQADGKAMAVGEIGTNGSYEMATGMQQGVAAGSYRVTVTAYETRAGDNDLGEPIPVFLTPARYNSPDTSGLTAEVKRGENAIDLTLTTEPLPAG